MLNIEKYAAIDIGSNAIRLLIATVTEMGEKPPHFKKTSLVRVPIRLGADVFLEGKGFLELWKNNKFDKRIKIMIFRVQELYASSRRRVG